MAPTSHADPNVAKSGWLLRRTNVLHHWKKAWFVLYKDGRIGHYEHEDKGSAEDLINIPHEKAIVIGPEYCRNIPPPTEKSADLLFGIKTRHKEWHMCANDQDDLLAWKLALQEALAVSWQPQQNQTTVPAYAGYVLPSYYGNSDQYTVYAPPGSTVTVTDRGPVVTHPDGRVVYVFEEDPYYRDYGSGAGTGLLTGMALGSLLCWPWWGFWWWC